MIIYKVCLPYALRSSHFFASPAPSRHDPSSRPLQAAGVWLCVFFFFATLPRLCQSVINEPLLLTRLPLQDIITDDEIISDSYDLKLIDGIVYEADCAMITEEAVNVGSSSPPPLGPLDPRRARVTHLPVLHPCLRSHHRHRCQRFR